MHAKEQNKTMITSFLSHFKRSFLVTFKNVTKNVEFVSFFGIFTQILTSPDLIFNEFPHQPRQNR